VPPTALEPLLDVEAVSRLTGLSTKTIRVYHATGRMPPSECPSPRRLRWRRETIDAWLRREPGKLAVLLRRAAALAPEGPVRDWLAKLAEEGVEGGGAQAG
jgi:predicted DNA-binding transcriptional regulator AlpA